MTRVPRLHLISSRELCPFERFPDIALAAVDGGVDAVHIREPDLPVEKLRPMVESIQMALNGTDCWVLVNSRVDVAVLVGADGVHVPEQDADPLGVRELIHPDCLVGVSVHSVDAAVRAARAGADYVMAGHVFETNSKPGQPGRGLDFISEVSRAVEVPVIAIGGISPGNTSQVIRAGAYGVAVLSAILSAHDPTAVAFQFERAMDEAGVRG